MKISETTAKVLMVIGILGMIGTAIALLFDIMGLINALGYASALSGLQDQYEEFGFSLPMGYILTSVLIWLIVHLVLFILFFYMFRTGKPRAKGKF